MTFEQTWRWFGPNDPITLQEILQTGATGIVTALHEIPNGEVWSKEAILARKRMVESAGLKWSVVESLPVTEEIKLATPLAANHINNYCQSLVNLASCGIRTVTYNFMPVLDWTRTDLAFRMPDGSAGLRFDMVQLALFDIYLLQRKSAVDDYPEDICQRALELFQSSGEDSFNELVNNIIAGLPGSEEHFTLDRFRQYLERYDGVSHADLKRNLKVFLSKVVPVAQEHDINLAIHPDDPPFDLFGLPRIVSAKADLEWVLNAADVPNNGLCFCTGSLGVRADNSVEYMAGEFASRIHFLHLRNIIREEDGSFFESDHLAGDVDMYGVLKTIINSSGTKRRLPYRPDHGHVMLDDFHKKTNPGYSAIGRMRGLAELRGLIHAIQLQS